MCIQPGQAPLLVLFEDALRAHSCAACDSNGKVKMTLEEALVAAWRQALIQRSPEVELQGQKFSVHATPNKHLLQVDFEFSGETIRGLEQNPKTASRWAQLARSGHKVMQFLSEGRYVANVVDGKVTLYGVKSSRTHRSKSTA
jgi:hypothetical protein